MNYELAVELQRLYDETSQTHIDNVREVQEKRGHTLDCQKELRDLQDAWRKFFNSYGPKMAEASEISEEESAAFLEEYQKLVAKYPMRLEDCGDMCYGAKPCIRIVL